MRISARARRIEPFYVMEVAKAAAELAHTPAVIEAKRAAGMAAAAALQAARG